MKTRNFSTVNIDVVEDGTCYLNVYAPEDGSVSVELSPDELLIFLVEVSNGLHSGRLMEVAKVIEKELQKEQRKML